MAKFSPCRPSSKQKPFVICLLLISLPILLLTLSLKPRTVPISTRIIEEEKRKPAWLDIIAKDIQGKKIKVGLVNIDYKRVDSSLYEELRALHPQVETVSVNFDRVDENLKWGDFFPEWIDEDQKWGAQKCPDMPMPALADYRDLDVVVAGVPCGKGTGKEGVRDLFRLQVNLVVANLAVESGWMKLHSHRTVYVVFIGSCGPMVEMFRCDDLLMHRGEFWVYKPELGRLKQKMLMPVGSCQIAPAYAETGKEAWRSLMIPATRSKHKNNVRVPRVAYVTVLHSSEAYVCGAIALAQSILQLSNQTSRDLLLLADKSISPKSIQGLKAAGWKIQRIQRILNPFAKKGTYNEWNYSKLRQWQLTQYDKVIYIDADIILLKSIDDFFAFPQLSAAPNDYMFFNSGLMIIEPSGCMFEHLMLQAFKVEPYNGGDQGFLNEVFPWWHRLPSRLNSLKVFQPEGNQKREIPEDVYAIHYLGLKPWMCYKDYDCNWDVPVRRIFASDSAHQRWWQVYEAMPKELQSYCGLTRKMDDRIRRWRRKARNATLSDGHWKIRVEDPRRLHYVD